MVDAPQAFLPLVILLGTFTILYLHNSGRTGTIKVPKVGYGWSNSSKEKNVVISVKDALLEGCRKFPTGFFKIKLYPYGTMTVVTDPKLVNELRNAPDEALSFSGGTERIFLPEYTQSALLTNTFHHIPTIRTTLSRNLGVLFDDIVDEMSASFEDSLPLEGHEWKAFPAYLTVMTLISRINNRIIVGLPHCRNVEYCTLLGAYMMDVFQTAQRINQFPKFLHPVVGPYYAIYKQYQKRMLDIVGPTIRERIDNLDKYGASWADKPNDYLTWMMEEDTGPLARDPEYLALRILQVNFASIFTSSWTFTHALYCLAANPSYADELREEASRAVKEEGGWTKSAVREMKKADSFLKESARLHALSLLILTREARKPFRFSNGLIIPKGGFVTSSLYSVHRDEGKYPEAMAFKPWRFVDSSTDTGSSSEKSEGGSGAQQYVATGPDYLAFGYGKHACPGRFFAANELKAMISYIVMNYDVQLEGGSRERPENVYMGASVSPNPTAMVMFRKRSKN